MLSQWNGRAPGSATVLVGTWYSASRRTECDSGLAIGIRELFRHHGGDTGHCHLGHRIVEHAADSAALGLAAGRTGLLRTTETEQPRQPATLLLLVGLLHGAGDFLW